MNVFQMLATPVFMWLNTTHALRSIKIGQMNTMANQKNHCSVNIFIQCAYLNDALNNFVAVVTQ